MVKKSNRRGTSNIKEWLLFTGETYINKANLPQQTKSTCYYSYESKQCHNKIESTAKQTS